MYSYGYDIAYACSIEAINRQLNKRFDQNGISIQYKGEDPSADVQIGLNCTLGAWQIISGGSGRLLRLHLPITDGTFSISGFSPKSKYDVSGVSVEIELQLAWLGPGTISPSGHGRDTNLVFNVQRSVPKGTPTTNGDVSVLQILDPQGHLDFFSVAVLTQQFANALVAHKDDISFTLAQVEIVPPNSTPWITPKKWDYLYQETDSGIAVLCILSMLTEKQLPPKPSFDTTVMSQGYDFFLILSEEQILRNLVVPQLPKEFEGGSSSNIFTFIDTGNGTGYAQNEGVLSLSPVHWSLETYYPKLTKFKVEVQGNMLQSTFEGNCSITGLAGASVSLNGLGNSTVEFDESSQTLGLGSQNTTVQYKKHIPWYDWALGVLSGGTGLLIIDTVMNSVTDTVQKSIANGVLANIPNVGHYVTNVVRWLDQSAVPNDGGLEDCVWFRGSLQ